MEGTDGFVVAVVGVIFRDGRVLAMRRAGTKRSSPGLWETVAGRVEPDEQPLDAMAREIAEECGLEVRIDPRPVDTYTMRRRGVPMVVIVFRADWVAGEVRRSEEHDDHAWWTPEELERRGVPPRLAEAVHRAEEG